mmetsp:Transcript_21323/g.48097  ORF Transcript_21323/g.48097 Transcript_21323/m.48097 type:complete len:383 (-) Transcript_21323:265-1413(-)
MSAVFVGATRQHVGKSSSCLGIVNVMKKKFGKCGFIKPVGQRHVPVEGGLRVDKDVKLMKEYFGLEESYSVMSPLVLPRGYTKKFIDGKITEVEQRDKILSAFEAVKGANPFTVVEGTGHCAVGSVVRMNNAEVAKLLDLKMVLVVNGGIGSAFDELALNVAVCEAAGAELGGILVNKIQPSKFDSVVDYFGRAISERWGVPLVGCVPYGDMMDAATFMDFENIFGTKLSSGHEHKLRHFAEYELAITDLNLFLEKLHTGAFNETLFVTHASRSDIVTGYLVYAATYERMTGKAMQGGILLSGSPSTPFGAWPDQALRKCIESSSVPILFTHVSTSETVKKLTKYVAKLNADDPSRTDSVVNQYSKHINEDKLLEVAGWKGN